MKTFGSILMIARGIVMMCLGFMMIPARSVIPVFLGLGSLMGGIFFLINKKMVPGIGINYFDN